MSKGISFLFGKTKYIEGQIDEFLDKISEGGMHFEIGINNYIDQDCLSETCDNKLQQLIEVKKRSNELRKAIGIELYTEMLIPDARGDVLSLLQDLYHLIDILEDNFQELVIQKPMIPTEAKQDFKDLTTTVVKSLETVIMAARAYFRDPMTVRDHTHKVSFYETESDNIAIRLKKTIFQSDLPLENKLQLRHAIKVIDEIADNAEDVSDWLAIYAIKRAL